VHAVVPNGRRRRSPWAEIPARPRNDERARRDDTIAELVRWARYLDPGPDASAPQHAAAVQAVTELAETPGALHDAWAASLRMLARGEVTRSLVALLADAMGAPEISASA
jgi:hypothetical protein